jgi:hypothetical protein
MASSCCTCMAWGIVPPHTSVVVLAPWACVVRPGPRTSRDRTSPAGRRLVVRGEDLSCDPSSGELVGDAANWPKTGCLASVGPDRGLQSSSF